MVRRTAPFLGSRFFFWRISTETKKKNAIFFSPIAQTKKSKRTNHEINGTVLGAPFRCVFVLFFDFFCFKFWPKREKKKRRRSVLSLRRTTLKIGRRLADNLRFVSCTTLRGPLLFCFCCLVFLFVCFFFGVARFVSRTVFSCVFLVMATCFSFLRENWANLRRFGSRWCHVAAIIVRLYNRECVHDC